MCSARHSRVGAAAGSLTFDHSRPIRSVGLRTELASRHQVRTRSPLAEELLP